jgi:hypothetical protein
LNHVEEIYNFKRYLINYKNCIIKPKKDMIFSHMNVESKYEAITTSITTPTSTLIAIPNSSWDFYGYCGQTNHGHG